MQRIVLRIAETLEKYVHRVIGGILVVVALVGTRALRRGKHRTWRQESEAAARRRAERGQS